MAGTTNLNVLVKSIVTAFKENCPQLMHKCPYIGRHELTNIKANKDLFRMVPKGVFRMLFKALDGSKVIVVFSSLLTVN